MMYGTISYYDGLIIIHVENYPRTRFMFYSKRDAITRYRRDNGLVGKHIYFSEY